MCSLLVLGLLFVSCVQQAVHAADSQPNKLLIVLLDGFRWDYIDKYNLVNFKRLQANGAHAGYVKNEYPTLSYPNYYSLMTGLYTESHGMTGNFMYDKDSGTYFLIAINPDHFNSRWWDGGEPLWVAAERKGKKAYMYFWPGCDVTIRNVKPTFCQPYVNVTSRDEFRTALQNATSKLAGTESADLAFVYHEEPDYVGHLFGPDSDQVKETLQGIDQELGTLLDTLQRIPAEKNVNLIVLSDHGMTNIDPSKTINITDVLRDIPITTIMENVALATIYTPNETSADQVYNTLKNFSPHMQVYKKKDVPDRLFYKKGKFVADVICIAEFGWTIVNQFSPDFPQTPQHVLKHGFHGYDNKEADMWGIFHAIGPYFKPKSEVTFIQAVDPYNILCELLGIPPAPNNGTRERLLPLLATSGAANARSPVLGWMNVIGCWISFGLIWMYVRI